MSAPTTRSRNSRDGVYMRTLAFEDDEDAFMQLLKAAMMDNIDLIEEELYQWAEDEEVLINGYTYQEVRGKTPAVHFYKEFVDETAYDDRDYYMDLLAEEMGLSRIERAWDLINEHEDDFADAFSKWVKGNTGRNGIGYPKPAGDGVYALWDDFVTDYGTRHADEILERYRSPGKGASGNRKPAAQKKSATRKPAAKSMAKKKPTVKKSPARRKTAGARR